MDIQRHKTAIKRYKLSRPVKLLLEHSVMQRDHTFFDYGCGHGQDLELLRNNGHEVAGYDPYYHPDGEVIASDIVNLGYVLNVIENPRERAETLKKSYQIANKALAVSVMTKIQQREERKEYSDGVISSTGTFQKFFDQNEIKNFIESTLQNDAVAVQPGIFFIFKEPKDKLTFLESRKNLRRERYHLAVDGLVRTERAKRILKPRIEEKIKESPNINSVLEFILDHGRMPRPEESIAFTELLNEFGSGKKIKDAASSLLPATQMENAISERMEELLIFFSIRRFDKLGFPKAKDIPQIMANDIKILFGSYRDFIKRTEFLLYSVGDNQIVAEAFKDCTIGKKLPDSHYIHPDYVDRLPAELQVLIGIAASLVGSIDGCNLIKLNKYKRKISFLTYENFDEVAHPALQYSLVVDIPYNDTKIWDYSTRDNPPILHRKETFVGEDYHCYNKFQKLTKQEEKAELLSKNTIGNREGWGKLLLENNLEIKGHRLQKVK